MDTTKGGAREVSERRRDRGPLVALALLTALCLAVVLLEVGPWGGDARCLSSDRDGLIGCDAAINLAAKEVHQDPHGSVEARLVDRFTAYEATPPGGAPITAWIIVFHDVKIRAISIFHRRCYLGDQTVEIDAATGRWLGSGAHSTSPPVSCRGVN